MSIRVRSVEEGDVEAVAALERTANSSVRSPEQLQILCTGSADAFESALIADNGGDLLGIVIYSQVLDEVSIHDIIIDPASRGCGFGGQLLREMLAVVRKRGVRRALLEVRSSNSPAIALYRGNGFCADGVRRSYYPSPEGREDAMLMSRVW
jgi:ribosomal-protein-alanine N-acetyltransferase